MKSFVHCCTEKMHGHISCLLCCFKPVLVCYNISWDVSEPSSCESAHAATCMANYVMRLLTSSFAPIGEYDDICW